MERHTLPSPDRDAGDSKSRRRRLRRRNRTNSQTKGITSSSEANPADDIDELEPEMPRVCSPIFFNVQLIAKRNLSLNIFPCLLSQIEQDCMFFVIPDEVMLRILCNLNPLDLVHIASASIVRRISLLYIYIFISSYSSCYYIAIILSCGRADSVEGSLRGAESENEYRLSDCEGRKLEEVLLLVR